jgi:hypothetical protein
LKFYFVNYSIQPYIKLPVGLPFQVNVWIIDWLILPFDPKPYLACAEPEGNSWVTCLTQPPRILSELTKSRWKKSSLLTTHPTAKEGNISVFIILTEFGRTVCSEGSSCQIFILVIESSPGKIRL